MNYTVNKLAKLSGVTIRTLHFYDEIGLLKPAYVADNGYRYYQESQLLMLQQILFFRELGFELKQIQEILLKSDFDKFEALQSHKAVLKKNITRLQQLLKTIDTTLRYLKGEKTMSGEEMFYGFDSEQQAQYEALLLKRFGDTVRNSVIESKASVKNWTKADWERSGKEFEVICKELVALMC